LIYKEDLNCLKNKIKEKYPLMNDATVLKYLQRNWRVVLDNCRRAVPRPKTLLQRFNKLVKVRIYYLYFFTF
jgi:hypothetical protein